SSIAASRNESMAGFKQVDSLETRFRGSIAKVNLPAARLHHLNSLRNWKPVRPPFPSLGKPPLNDFSEDPALPFGFVSQGVLIFLDRRVTIEACSTLPLLMKAPIGKKMGGFL